MPITDLATNVILDNVGKVYFLKTGVYRDQVGLDNNHPLSSVSALLIHIEDGVPQNVMVANYAPSKMASWASHDFPLWYRGQVEYTITGESSPRTFAQYFTYVPSILVAMNKNGTSIMDVNVTITQSTGANLLGGFSDLMALYTEFPPTKELSDDLATAYVYDSGTKGFYRVAWNSGASVWVWQLVVQALVTYGVQTKQYNVLPIKVQRGFAPNQTPLTVSDEVIRLIYQEIAYVNAVIANHTELIQDLDDELVAHMADLDNPHEVTALQTAYSNIVSLLTATTVQGAIDEIVGRLDTAEEDIVALEGRMDTAEEDIDDLETFQNVTVPATYETIANADTHRGRTTALENANMVKTITRTGDDLITITFFDNTNTTVITLAQLKSFIGEATNALSGLMTAQHVTDLEMLMALFDGDGDAVVNTIAEVLAIFEDYPEGVDLVTALAGKVDKTTKIAGVDLQNNITKEELQVALDVDDKVDKVTGKSLVSDTEITKLTALDNQATLDGKINAKESVVNKGDMSVINTTKYPHTEGVRNYVRDIGLDTPIIQLNNHSLREVFEDAYVDLTTFTVGGFVTEYNYNEGITTFLTNGTGSATTSYTIWKNNYYNALQEGNVIYHRIDALSISGETTFRIIYPSNITTEMNTSNYTKISTKNILTFGGFGNLLSIGTQGASGKLSVKNLYVVDMSNLGFDTLTVEQMDYWYSVYQTIKNGTTTGGLLTTLYDLFSSKANTTLETWITPTLVNSWAGTTARYYKNNFGEIRLAGSITTGTIGTTAFTLPTGYRPSQIVRCPVESNGAFGYVVINTDGTVVPTAGSNVRFSLDGVYFRGA